MRKHSNYALRRRAGWPDDTGANVTYGRVANSTNDPGFILVSAGNGPMHASSRA